MAWRNILSLSIVTACGLTMLSAGAVGQQRSLKDQLLGTWTLAAWEQTRPDGTKFHSFGTNPRGILVVSADGRFFQMFAHPDLPKIAASNRAKVTPEEAQAIVGRVIAYYGTYTVDEPSKTVTLQVDASTFPNQMGAQLKRVVNSVTADELTFTNPAPMSGGQIQVSMKRATAATVGGPQGR
jgi:lipocalin-like protein